MKPEKTIPVTLVTGFLGAGKTSLINHLLQDDCHQCQAVLVNDFGALKLDTDLVSPYGVVQLIQGCVCCSGRKSLQDALQQIIAITPRPERILVETSSVADPCAIKTALEIPELKKHVALQQLITVVAADRILDLKDEMARLVKMQLSCASLVIVNKIDLVSEGQLNRVLSWLQAVKTDLPVFTTSHGAVPIDFLQDPRVLKTTASEEFINGCKS
jgi:G3E family GTPase